MKLNSTYLKLIFKHCFFSKSYYRIQFKFSVSIIKRKRKHVTLPKDYLQL